LEIANKIYESGLVKFSTPNFISYSELHQVIPNDTYFNRQIACHNTGQVFTDGHSGTNDADIDAPEAWGITTGCNDIVIAVLDQGVTPDHPDLPNSRQIRLAGSNFVEGNDDPSPGGNANHGNACAGVIAATMNNNQGIAGIASNCKIMPIRIYDDNGNGVIAELKADALELAVDSGANILSNSWGYESTDQNLHPVIVTAINYALNSNRIVIFSAGNTANHNGSDDGYVTFPANVNISGVITVGASDRNDDQANYSPTSSLIDIVAPSHRAYPSRIAGETLEMWSIDIPGNSGYNSYPSDPDMPHPPTTGETLPNTGTNNLAYTARFGGTSHACPVVAAVAALMLSVNPDLSNEDVYDILTFQARKVGGFTYTNGRCNEMGYGRVDAYASVYYALDMNISGPSPICMAGTYTVNNLLSGATIEWTQSSNLTRVSAQGANPCTFSVNGSGGGWVGATINRSCGSINLPHENIWLGVPDYTLLDIDLEGGELIACDYTSAEADYDGTAGIDGFEWDIPDADDWNIEEESGSGPDNKYVEIEYWEDPTPYQEDIYIRAHNSCGWSYWKRTTWSVEDNCGWLLVFTPNPATGETTLSIESATEETQFDINEEWDLEIYNNNQTLKEKKTKLKGNEYRFNTSNWKEGVYMVRVTYKDEILTGKLVVKR
jgi:subtilisin family serine protease